MFASSQEKIIAVFSLFSLFLGVVYVAARNKHVFEAVYMIVVALVSLGLSLLNVWCVINGGCTVWSWFLTLMIAVGAIITIVIYSKLLMKGTKEEEGGQIQIMNKSWSQMDDY
jgi:predicted membrane-bound dolichyl-phosphate-mannose-protein mannosyltransferase